MKKIFLLLLLNTLFTISGNSQEIGIRFGDVTGGNVAIDAVFSAEGFDRIHADLSFGNGGIGIDALWDFLYKPLGDEVLNWYVGTGPTLLLGDDFSLGIAGEVGLEYAFQGIPIVIGTDWRPQIRIIDNTDFVGGNFGLNVRWVFN